MSLDSARNRTRKGAAGSNPADARVETIVAAATHCVRKYGARKVSIEDIANEAGIGRRTLYRYFANRRAVMQAVMFDRLSRMAADVREILARCDGFEDALITGSLETIRLAKADRIYSSLVEDDHTLTLDRDNSLTGTQLLLSNWAPIFDKAREDGIMRADISNHEAALWLGSLHYMLIWREEWSDAQKRQMIRKFIVPSFELRTID